MKNTGRDQTYFNFIKGTHVRNTPFVIGKRLKNNNIKKKSINNLQKL